jgi:thioredoxin-like negative regulator of GroEL
MIERLLLAVGLAALGIVGYLLFDRWRLRRANREAGAGSGKPVVLYFRSDHCAPCVTQSRFLEQLQAAFGERLKIEKIDADAEQERAERYGVFTLPTTLVVDAGGVVRHANYGLADARKLTRQLDPLVSA